MAKNTLMTRDANVVVAVTLASAAAGNVYPIGDDGLTGYALTDTYEADADTGLYPRPQGLADGQASVELLGVTRVIDVDVDGDPELGDAVYADGDGTYSTSSGGTFIGWWVPGLGVALAPSQPPTAGS